MEKMTQAVLRLKMRKEVSKMRDMYIKIAIIIFLFMILSPFRAISQSDTSFVCSKVKMYLFEEIDDQLITQELLDSFYSQKLSLRKLESQGFRNLTFYHVPIQILSSIKVDYNKYKEIWLPVLNSYKYYVVAWQPESNNVFRISGFNNCDIEDIIDNKEYFVDTNTGCFFDLKKRKTYDCLWVEDIDFADLLKQLYSSRRQVLCLVKKLKIE